MNEIPEHSHNSEQDALDLGAALVERAGNPVLAEDHRISIGVVDEHRMLCRGSRVCVPRRWLAYPVEVIEAGIAHEIGHLVGYRTSADLRRSQALRRTRTAAVSLWAVGSLGLALNLYAVWVCSFIAALAVGHASSYINRRTEYQADRYAANLVGSDSVTRMVRDIVLRSGALRRAENMLELALGLATHPTPDARIRRLARTAAYTPAPAEES